MKKILLILLVLIAFCAPVRCASTNSFKLLEVTDGFFVRTNASPGASNGWVLTLNNAATGKMVYAPPTGSGSSTNNLVAISFTNNVSGLDLFFDTNTATVYFRTNGFARYFLIGPDTNSLENSTYSAATYLPKAGTNALANTTWVSNNFSSGSGTGAPLSGTNVWTGPSNVFQRAIYAYTNMAPITFFTNAPSPDLFVPGQQFTNGPVRVEVRFQSSFTQITVPGLARVSLFVFDPLTGVTNLADVFSSTAGVGTTAEHSLWAVVPPNGMWWATSNRTAGAGVFGSSNLTIRPTL